MLCKCKNKNYYFFPGGHINFGERAADALNREIKEELGISVKKPCFIGVVENFYTEDRQKHHEFILAFEVKLNNLKIKSRENHIKFFLKSKKELLKEKVFPVAMSKAVLKWSKSKKIFWASQINKIF